MPLFHMLWFYSRNRDLVRLETRYDNDTQEYIGVVTHSDSRQTERFSTLEEFRAWLIAIERQLVDAQWFLKGTPQILPNGWPDKRPPQ
jgi:hypothetical protein